MSKQTPYMVLDLTKKPGDENAVKTGDMLLAENERLKAEIERLRQPGNEQACRKALERVKVINDSRPHDGPGYEINDIIEEALAEPPRNCDLPNPEERYAEFCSRYQSCFSCPYNRTLNELRCDGKWLLAHTTERKGGAK